MAIGIIASATLLILCGCGPDTSVPGGAHLQPKAECACYATLTVTEDGGVCERPGALCPRVCTCTEMPLCHPPARPVVCVGDDGDGG